MFSFLLVDDFLELNFLKLTHTKNTNKQKQQKSKSNKKRTHQSAKKEKPSAIKVCTMHSRPFVARLWWGAITQCGSVARDFGALPQALNVRRHDHMMNVHGVIGSKMTSRLNKNSYVLQNIAGMLRE